MTMLHACKYCETKFKGRKERVYCSQVCRNKGREITEETREKFSIFHTNRKRNPFSLGTKVKMSLAKTSEMVFKGFRSTSQHRLRNSKEYDEWRLYIFTRDKFACQGCKRVGGTLESHHIKSMSKYPEVMFDVNNGVTLCKWCHAKVDKYRRIGETSENK